MNMNDAFVVNKKKDGNVVFTCKFANRIAIKEYLLSEGMDIPFQMNKHVNQYCFNASDGQFYEYNIQVTVRNFAL